MEKREVRIEVRKGYDGMIKFYHGLNVIRQCKAGDERAISRIVSDITDYYDKLGYTCMFSY